MEFAPYRHRRLENGKGYTVRSATRSPQGPISTYRHVPLHRPPTARTRAHHVGAKRRSGERRRSATVTRGEPKTASDLAE